MARIRIPKNAGAEFEIIVAMAGNYAVWNHKTGKNKLLIPCRDKEQAEEILRVLKEKDHNGEIWL
jgi:hypothetical protein